MQTRKIFDFFEVAGKLALARKDGRSFFHGGVGLRRDGTIVYAVNGSAGFPNKFAHCEARLARKLDVGSTVFVARITTGTKEFANSTPCHNCLKIMKTRGIKRVYFTKGPNEFGWLDLN